MTSSLPGTGSYPAPQAVFLLEILLPPPPKCCIYRCVQLGPPCSEKALLSLAGYLGGCWVSPAATCLECQVEPVLALRSQARFSDFIPVMVAREVKFLPPDSASDTLAEF